MPVCFIPNANNSLAVSLLVSSPRKLERSKVVIRSRPLFNSHHPLSLKGFCYKHSWGVKVPSPASGEWALYWKNSGTYSAEGGGE